MRPPCYQVSRDCVAGKEVMCPTVPRDRKVRGLVSGPRVPVLQNVYAREERRVRVEAR